MKIKRKLIAFVISFAMLLSLIPTLSVQAATTDFKIISDTKVTAEQAKKWAKSKGATQTFIDLADLYFKYAPDHGDVNPAIAYVQAAKETGFGKFGGVLDDSYHNPCGLKKPEGGGDTDPNAHQKFASWDEGVQAHLDHLALYAGADGYPRSTTYDPRHFVTIKGKAKTVNSLGTKWAPSATYGEEVNQLYKGLMDFAGVDYPKDTTDNSSNNVDKNNSSSSNGTPNPGKPENKPSALDFTDVIKLNNTQNGNAQQEDKPSITSSIGWKSEDGDWYYYKSDNTKAIGWIKPDSNWYYLKDDGKMAKGWLKDNGKWYYFENSGAMSKGWRFVDGDWYLLSASGDMLTGVQFDGSNLYYLFDSGVMANYKGWKKINEKWYYFENSGKIKTGWFKENNNWYYLQGDGSMATGLKKIDNNNYMLNTSGAMVTGWILINNNWYYFNSDGSLATGWLADGGNYYYLYDTGAMAKGWINIGDAWYYLQSNGAIATGWFTFNGDSYYLDPATGKMAINTTKDGYTIGADGKKQTASSNQSNDDKSSSNTTDDKTIPSDNKSNSSNNTGTSNGKKTIVIDPGHDYGKDYGAESTIDGVTYSETILNMQVADKLKTELESKGYNVIMTRKLGEKPSYGSLMDSLTHRVNVANSAKADFFISLHHNSAGETAKGVLTLYSSESQDDSFGGKLDNARIQKSKQIATLINNNIASKLNLNNRGGQEQNLFVCRNTNIPAVLVEVGFITNKEEAIRCADPASQQKVAQAIAEVLASNV